MGLMRASSPIDRRLGAVPLMLEAVYSWTARPLGSVTAKYRGNVLFRERCILTRLTQDLNQLLFAQDESDARVLVQEALDLRKRLFDWYESLPSDLSYDTRLPAPLHEMQ